MNTTAMNAEAARCFRRACETSDPLDQTIFIGLRQAWLALSLQVQQRRMEPPRLSIPAADFPAARSAKERTRPARTKRLKSGTAHKPARGRRRKLAA
jgi:hypothetical protein